VTWQTLAVLYVGVCAGWGAKEGWATGGFSDALGQGFVHLVWSPIVPFVLVGYVWERRQRLRSEREQVYAAYGGYRAYRRQLREHRSD
jgi:hypothetical protein